MARHRPTPTTKFNIGDFHGRLGSDGIISDQMGSDGIISGQMVSYLIRWDQMGSNGIISDQMGTGSGMLTKLLGSSGTYLKGKLQLRTGSFCRGNAGNRQIRSSLHLVQ